MSSSPESPAHSAPIDEPQRRRFITELDGNFSVVAAAGSGKTRAITERIIEIATSPPRAGMAAATCRGDIHQPGRR